MLNVRVENSWANYGDEALKFEHVALILLVLQKLCRSINLSHHMKRGNYPDI